MCKQRVFIVHLLHFLYFFCELNCAVINDNRIFAAAKDKTYRN